MGEWSEFFEDFPEENPSNWVGGVYIGPNGAQLHREHQARYEIARSKTAADQARLDATISKIIAAGVERAKLKADGDS